MKVWGLRHFYESNIPCSTHLLVVGLENQLVLQKHSLQTIFRCNKLMFHIMN